MEMTVMDSWYLCTCAQICMYVSLCNCDICLHLQQVSPCCLCCFTAHIILYIIYICVFTVWLTFKMFSYVNHMVPCKPVCHIVLHFLRPQDTFWCYHGRSPKSMLTCMFSFYIAFLYCAMTFMLYGPLRSMAHCWRDPLRLFLLLFT